MSPKENKDKQIDQNAQKNLAKCDADVVVIYSKTMIFSKKFEKEKYLF